MTPDIEGNVPKDLSSVNLVNKKIEKSWLDKIWSNAVWSKIIATIIISVGAIIYSLIVKFNILGLIKELLLFRIEVFKVILIALIVTSFMLLYSFLKKRFTKQKNKNYFDIKITDLTFSELFNILICHKLPNPQSLSSKNNSENDLITFFTLYIRKFNLGVEHDFGGDQGNFMYYVLGPVLISYSLVERRRPINDIDILKMDVLYTSEIGLKFYRYLQYYLTINSSEFKDW